LQMLWYSFETGLKRSPDIESLREQWLCHAECVDLKPYTLRAPRTDSSWRLTATLWSFLCRSFLQPSGPFSAADQPDPITRASG
jgi:hypothetical protein